MPSSDWHIDRHDSLASTNSLATQMVLASWNRDPAFSTVHHRVIVARRQFAGRGQHGRTWESPIGGLYLSAILTDFPVLLRDRLALIAGAAVAKCFDSLQIPDVQIRWPNDLLLAGQKVAGILCESLAQGNLWAGIIGIGVNVNTAIDDLSPALQSNSTSLCIHADTPLDLARIESNLLDHLSQAIREAGQSGLEPCLRMVRKIDYLSGKQVACRAADGVFAGTAAGIGDEGELLLRTADSRILSIPAATLLSIDGLALHS